MTVERLIGRTWRFQFENYLAVIQVDFVEEMKLAEESTNPAVVQQDRPDSMRRSIILYALLSACLEKRSLALVKSIANKNGVEAWRQLVKLHEPKHGSRELAMLTAVLDGKGLHNLPLERYEAGLLEWEQHVREYEALSSERVQDRVKRAVLVRYAPTALQQHVSLNAERFTTYDSVKQAIKAYIIQQQSTAQPMDIGVVADKGGKAKGKDKEKGKGKESRGQKRAKEKRRVRAARAKRKTRGSSRKVQDR